MSTDKIALVTGYTGESGKALVKELISNKQFKKIILVGRRKVDYTDNEYKEKTVLYYDRFAKF
jgi:NAD(P)-dependent dehydrogenase (short-subunit alcohol dehydrogenase family)